MSGKTRKSEVAVQTPLHLLQVLTRTLNEHLAAACDQAQADAGKVLEKLDRERQKRAEKLDDARRKLAAGNAEGNGRSADKRQSRLAELTERLDAVNRAHTEAEEYIRQLQSDVRQTLRLAKGLERIDQQATQAIEKRNNPDADAGKRPPTRRPRSRKPAASADTPAPASQPAQPQDQ